MMLKSPVRSGCNCQIGTNWKHGSARSFWSQHREASLNWLALGLLLAAWNASDDEAATHARRRPDSLRGYSYVSVRAATRHSTELRPASTHS
jgi:hypothetical protein